MKNPSQVAKDTRVGGILDEYLRAFEAGSAPDREALLARHPDVAEELAAAFRGLDLVRGAASGLASAGDGEIGTSLGDYRLLREVGRGGMAVVYEAEQVSLGRRVALKVLPFAAVLDAKQLQRFKNEALAAAHLRHPNVVPVYAVGCERGVHYYAMQYVEGQSLALAIRDLKGGGTGEGAKTPISSHGSNRERGYIRMAAALGKQAAEALDHAHELGIVHRDVKPGNLLVDEAGALWVTDFGLASSVADVSLTATGEILGTIRYMSPEQALAKRAPIDHRTDVYSLGATLYELFTLEPAFPGDDPHRVMQDIAVREPVPPRRLNPALPVDLETVLLKAMSKDPVGRYATAQEMADDLGRFLEDRPVEAKRPGLLRRAAKWRRRHRTLVGTAAIVLVLAVAGFATATTLLWREQTRTNAAFGRAESNLELALKALDEIYLDEAEGHPRIREGLPKDLLERGLRFYEAFASDNADHQDAARMMGNAYHTASMIHRELGDAEGAAEALDRAIAIYREVARVWPEDSRPHSNLGMALTDKGDIDEAISECREAIRLQPDNGMAHHNLARALEEKGDRKGAIGEYREAIRLDPNDVKTRANLVCALMEDGDTDAAMAEAREATRIDPNSAQAHVNLGVVLLDKNPEGAVQEFREAIRLRPQYAGAHHNLALALQQQGDTNGAILEHREAIRLKPSSAASHACLGALLAQRGELDEAIREFRETTRWAPDNSMAHYDLGILLNRKGDTDGALEEFREAVRIDPDDANARMNLGVLLERRGELDGAMHEWREALRIDPANALAHRNLGGALLETGDLPGAILEIREAVRLEPDDAKVHYALALALQRTGEEDAIPELREAIRLKADFVEAHFNLGCALEAVRDFEGAIAAYGDAIRWNPDLAEAHTNLGNLFLMKGDPDAAILEYREAVRLEPDDPDAHANLGNALRVKGNVDAAIEEYRRALQLKPDHCVWLNLGTALFGKHDLDGAIVALREATRLGPDEVGACCALGLALCYKTRYEEALRWLRRGDELGSKPASGRATLPGSGRILLSKPFGPDERKQWIEFAERGAAVEQRMNLVLAGEAQPTDAQERIVFAEMLCLRDQHAEAARMFAEAFAEEPSFADDLETYYRYNAACCAAVRARDATDAPEWRARALAWLRADLAAREKAGLVDTLEGWKGDADFATVRDRLADLPAEEREAWAKLWADVDAVLAARK